MNINKVSKIAILIITFMLIVCTSTTVFADEPMLDFSQDNGAGDDIPSLDGDFEGTEGENTPVEPEQTPTTPEDTPVEPEPTPENTPTEPEQPSGNTSTYEDSNIPYAGPAETMIMVVAFIACGIVGIYTFMKLSEYSNI